MITIEVPGRGVLDFPDGTTDEQIDQVIVEEFPLRGEDVKQRIQEDPEYDLTLEDYKVYEDWQKSRTLGSKIEEGIGMVPGVIDHLGTVLGEGIVGSFTSNPLKAPANAVEGFFQGTKGLWQMLAHSENPDSILFGLQNFVFGDGTIESRYEQTKRAIEFRKSMDRNMAGEETVLLPKDWVDNRVVQAVALVADPTVAAGFLTGGSSTVAGLGGKLGRLGKLAEAGNVAAQKATQTALHATGTAMRVAAAPVTKAVEAAGKGIEAVTGIAPKNIHAGAVAAGGAGFINPATATAGAVIVGAEGADLLGDALQRVAGGLGGQPSRIGALESVAMDATAPRSVRTFARAAHAIGGDLALDLSLRGASGAVTGAAVGGLIGYGYDDVQGGIAGSSAGAFLGGAGAGLFRSIEHGLGRVQVEAQRADAQRWVSSIASEKHRARAAEASAIMEAQIPGSSALLADADVAMRAIGGELRFVREETSKRIGGQDNAQGFFRERGIGGKPTMILNLDAFGKTTAPHEAVHALLRTVAGGEQLAAARDILFGTINPDGTINQDGVIAGDTVKAFAEKYRDLMKGEARDAWDGYVRDAFNENLDLAERLAAQREIADEFTAYYGGYASFSKGLFGKTRYNNSLMVGKADTAIGVVLKNARRFFEGRTRRQMKMDFSGSSIESPFAAAKNPGMNRFVKDVMSGTRDTQAEGNAATIRYNMRNANKGNMQALADAGFASAFVRDADGKVIRQRTVGEERVQLRAQFNAVRDALIRHGIDPATRLMVNDDGTQSFNLGEIFGNMDPAQQTGLMTAMERFLGPSHRRFITQIAGQMSAKNKAEFGLTYWSATTRSKRDSAVYASLGASERNVVPYSIEVSAEGGVYIRALDMNAIQKRFDKAWQKSGRGLFGKDGRKQALAEFNSYLDNLTSDKPVASADLKINGLKIGEDKRNFFYEVLGTVPSQSNRPPLDRAPRPGYVPDHATDKVFKSFRVDRMAKLDMTGKSLSFTEEGTYRRSQANFQPEDAKPIKPEDAEKAETESGSLGEIEPVRDIPIDDGTRIEWDGDEIATTFQPQADPNAYPDLNHAILAKIAAETGGHMRVIHIDRAKVGEMLGIDIQGGMHYPAIIENLAARAVWAFNSRATAEAVYKSAMENGGYLKLVLMAEGNVVGNKTFAHVWFKALEKNIESGKANEKKALALINNQRSSVVASAAGRVEKARAKLTEAKESLDAEAIEKAEKGLNSAKKKLETTKKQMGSEWKSLSEAREALLALPQSRRAATFFKRSGNNPRTGETNYGLMLKKSDTEKFGMPDVPSLVKEFEHPAFDGVPTGAAVAVIKLDKADSPGAAVFKASDLGVPEHLSYQYVVKGEPIAKMTHYHVLTERFRSYDKLIDEPGNKDWRASRAEARDGRVGLSPNEIQTQQTVRFPIEDLFATPDDHSGVLTFQPSADEIKAKVGKMSASQIRTYLANSRLTPTSKVAKWLGKFPKYLEPVVDYVVWKRTALASGTLSPRDVAKAYFITISSIGASAIKIGKLEATAKRLGIPFDPDPIFLATNKKGEAMMRPEEAAAWWLGTEPGQRALDAIETGVIDQAAWETGMAFRDAFGRNDFRPSGKRTGGTGQLKNPKKEFNLTNILDLTRELNAAKGDGKKLRDTLTKVKGIADGKKGFIGHLLGMGDTATIDAVELNFWLTGEGSTRYASTAAKTRVQVAKTASEAASRDLFNRIQNRIEFLRNVVDGGDKIPAEVAPHIIHHWLWDKAKGLETTHAGLYHAMTKFQPASERIASFENKVNQFTDIFLKHDPLTHKYDRKFHLNTVLKRVLNDFNPEPYEHMLSRTSRPERAKELRREVETRENAFRFIADGTLADLAASLPETAGTDLKTGEKVNPVQPLLESFPGGSKRNLVEVLGELVDVYRAAFPDYRSRDLRNVIDLIGDEFAEVPADLLDRVYEAAEGMSKAAFDEKNAERIKKFLDPEFNDVSKQGNVTVSRRIDPDTNFQPGEETLRKLPFKEWAKDSVVKDEGGNLKRVYRGEHGIGESGKLHSRSRAITFSSHPDSASRYAMHPNNPQSDTAKNPRVTPAYLRITKPWINSPDDPFVDLATIEKVSGRETTLGIIERHSSDIENTGAWEEFSETHDVESVSDAMKKGLTDEVIQDLYLLAFPVLDDNAFVASLVAEGYDGAIHAGYGSGPIDEVEYKVFSPAQARSALDTGHRFQPSDADYMKAVKDGDMEAAQQMVIAAAEKSGLPLLDDTAMTAYKVRRSDPPKKTVKAYKLFATKPSAPGKLFPLFVGANDPVPTGVWLDATVGPEASKTKTGKQQVKSKLGPLAFRPGWHAGDLPLATHIGVKDASGRVAARRANEVWAEVEMAADVDYQPVADRNGRTKDGGFSAAKADIRTMPDNGFYRYKTNPNMTGQWLISGQMKINRVLTENQVNTLLKRSKVEPMPWEGGKLDLKSLGISSKPSRPGKLLDPVTYDSRGKVIPLSKRFDKAKDDPRFQPAEDAKVSQSKRSGRSVKIGDGRTPTPAALRDYRRGVRAGVQGARQLSRN